MSIDDEAEDWLSLEASRGDLVVNKSIRDRAGWDHIFDLNLKRPPSPTDPLSLPTTFISGRFQVKGTRGRTRRVRMKLSNWRNAIDDPLPWFVVVVVFGAKSKEPHEVAIFHVDRQLVEKAMERLYSVDASSLKKLHRVSLSVTWTEQDVIRPPYHESLLQVVTKAIPGNLHEYAATKRAWCETAGYAVPPVAEATFTVEGQSRDDLMERVSRVVVGLDESIEIANFSAVRDRFGSPRPDPRLPRASLAKLSVMPTPADSGFELALVDENGSHKHSLPVKIPVLGRSNSGPTKGTLACPNAGHVH